MKTAIVTGANGFIGSHLLCLLLAQGWRVHALGRSDERSRWEERVFGAIREVGIKGEFCGRLFCSEVDLAAPELKLQGAFPPPYVDSDATLFHLAGDTRFRPANPELQRQINVQAPLNLVSALRGGIGRVVHVSTAYVAGKRSGRIQEHELNRGQEFWNSYEQSKFDAEQALTDLCREQAIPLVIVRPSIIINDRRTGRASTFTHLNAMVEVVSRIQDYYGISDGQVVSQAIRVLAEPLACPNLAAVDSIVPALLRIAESAAAPGQTFHLCHPQPQANQEVLKVICEAFQVKDRVALEFVSQLAKPMSRTEEMIARSLKVYAPYLNNACAFDVSNSRKVVPEYNSLFTPLDVPYVRKVITYQRQHRHTRGEDRPQQSQPPAVF